jgi:hypothetical protein
MKTERAKRVAEFVSWVGANIRADERGEAKSTWIGSSRRWGMLG